MGGRVFITDVHADILNNNWNESGRYGHETGGGGGE